MSDLQNSKAPSPIEVTESEMLTEVRAEHLEKAYCAPTKIRVTKHTVQKEIRQGETYRADVRHRVGNVDRGEGGFLKGTLRSNKKRVTKHTVRKEKWQWETYVGDGSHGVGNVDRGEG